MKRRTQFFLQADGKVVADEMVTLRKSEVDQLIAEVNALRADKERLDWLETNGREQVYGPTWRIAWQFGQDVSLRAAIDAARNGGQP